MNNRNKKLIALVIGLVVILGGAYMLTRDRGETAADLNAQTYRSREHEFTFSIPKGFSYIESREPKSGRESVIVSRVNDEEVPEAGEGPTAVSVDVFTKPSSLDPEAWVKGNNVSNFNLIVGDTRETSVGGTKALSYEWDGLYRGRSAVFEHDGNIILISGTYLNKDDATYSAFDKVVESFEF